jgi:tryptophan 7-halogenase
MNAERHSVLVIGSGVTALMAAVSLARRLPDVHVVRLDTGITDPVDDLIGACRPSIRTFHAALGIDEADVIARTRANYRLGTALSGWADREVFRGHGMYGEPLSGVAFHHLWLRAQGVEPYESFSINASLAARGRFAPPSSVPGSPLAGLDYGLQLDLPAYGQALRSLGRVAGVEEVQGAIASVQRTEDGSGIGALQLTDGRDLTADSYVDADGRGAIVRRSLASKWVDWSDALLVDRLCVVRKEMPAHLVQDSVIASESGWRYESAAAQAWAYSSAHRNDRSGAIAFRQGRLEDPWGGNCIAIGSAAVSLEPSAATGLHTVCRHIERLIGCWPGHASHATEVEVAFYNRRTALEADRMRDFVQLPYLLNERPEPFWRAAAAGPVSAQLARDLALFRERGRLAIHDEDGFERDEWIASLIGFGIRPRHIDALAQELPVTRIQQRLEAIRL